MKTPSISLWFCLCAMVAAFATSLRAQTPQALPNVIVVLADDLGIGDLQCTSPDCKIKTPNLLTMTNEGLTFMDAHTPSAVCTPTRYGLLTGRYNWRSRLKKGVLIGYSKHLIPAERATVAHLMHKAGYNTQMIGKWHLGWDWTKLPKGQTAGDDAIRVKKQPNVDFTKPVLNGPDINGFDGYYGHCGSLDMAPYVWVDTGKVTAQPNRVEEATKEEHTYGWYRKGPVGSDFVIDEVLPHLFQKSISHIKAKAPAAKQGKPFFLYLPLPAPHTPIVPVPPFKDASGMNPYADFVMQVDHHMGELMASLKDAGIDDNTIVIFTSDNGCSPQANFEVLEKFGHAPSGGYRGHKADIFEGGHRVPLVVRWPSKIKGGQKTNALTCLTDIYSTLQELTGQPREDDGGEDSYSLMNVFKGATVSDRTSLVSHSIGGQFSIREGEWKLCLCAGSGGWSSPKESLAKKRNLPAMQLFNLKSDREEQNNLVAAYPEKVKSLLQLLGQQVADGRCTPGKPVPNDGEVEFLPDGVKMPEGVMTPSN